MKVTLVGYTPRPLYVCAEAAAVCYDSEPDLKIVKGCIKSGHQSVLEHCSFTFKVEGISRACSHQLVRHRIASYSQQSQRYVDGTSFEFVTPPEIAKNPDIADKYIEALETESRLYAEIRNALIVQKIKEYVQSDGDAELALGDLSIKTDEEITDIFKEYDKKRFSAFEKLANEDARFILPNACTTKIICTFNARSLYNFFEHRCCNRAQWEIRDVARQMLILVKQVAPILFAKAGPPCLYGACPEGKMSCGKAKEVRRKFGAATEYKE